MDIAAVGAAYTGLKFAKDALQVALGYKIETTTRAQITAALEKLGAAQDSLFGLREELFYLQSENDRLRQEVAACDEWNAVKAPYNEAWPGAARQGLAGQGSAGQGMVWCGAGSAGVTTPGPVSISLR